MTTKHNPCQPVDPTNPKLTYVTVIHKPTGRSFKLNRQYAFIGSDETPMNEGLLAITKNIAVDTWDGWPAPNKPEWARDLPDGEFLACWHF